MNDTQQTGPGPEGSGGPTSEDPGFDARRLRTVTDMQRSRSNGMVGGVCAGAARYLDLDPVVLRIAFVVLTFVGGAGLILYLAAWFFLPTEDGPSVAAEWFNLDENEERVRVGGLVVAAVVAVLSVVGDAGWGFPWWIVPVGILFLVFVVLPNRRRDRRIAESVGTPAEPDYGVAFAQAKADEATRKAWARAREPRSNALLGLTVSVTAIAMAVTRLVADANGGTPWTTYVAVALAIVGLGLVISTFFGHGGPLIPIGIVLAAVLTVGSALPSLRVGEQVERPTTAAAVDAEYVHGIGKVELDLTDVSNPQALLGRTVTIDSGIGETRVIVPDDLDVAVDAELKAGEITVFDRKTNGTDNQLDVPADSARHLTIDIEHRLGTIEVIRQ